jgi:hypothetical protein
VPIALAFLAHRLGQSGVETRPAQRVRLEGRRHFARLIVLGRGDRAERGDVSVVWRDAYRSLFNLVDCPSRLLREPKLFRISTD